MCMAGSGGLLGLAANAASKKNGGSSISASANSQRGAAQGGRPAGPQGVAEAFRPRDHIRWDRQKPNGWQPPRGYGYKAEPRERGSYNPFENDPRQPPLNRF